MNTINYNFIRLDTLDMLHDFAHADYNKKNLWDFTEEWCNGTWRNGDNELNRLFSHNELVYLEKINDVIQPLENKIVNQNVTTKKDWEVIIEIIKKFLELPSIQKDIDVKLAKFRKQYS